MGGDPTADRIRRIQGLMAKADATESEHERDALMRRAYAIMAQYGIERAQLAASGKKPDEIVHRTMEPLRPWESERFMLLTAIAGPMRVAVVKQVILDKPWSYSVLGYESDLDRVLMLFKYLDAHVMMRLGKLPVPAGHAARTYRKDWLKGFCVAVNLRINQAEGTAAEEASAGQPGTDLILRDRQQAVRDATLRAFPGAQRPSTQVRMTAASGDGFQEGSRVDLGRGSSVGDTTGRRAVGQ